MITLLLVLLAQAEARPRFHCYTQPNSHVGAYQTPVKCQGAGDKMEIVCTYAAGCMPVAANAPAQPPPLTNDQFTVMATSNELKSSMLICKGKGEVKDGVITNVQCPPPTQCLTDGLYGGVSADTNAWTDGVAVPQTGGPRATR